MCSLVHIILCYVCPSGAYACITETMYQGCFILYKPHPPPHLSPPPLHCLAPPSAFSSSFPLTPPPASLSGGLPVCVCVCVCVCECQCVCVCQCLCAQRGWSWDEGGRGGGSREGLTNTQTHTQKTQQTHTHTHTRTNTHTHTQTQHTHVW